MTCELNTKVRLSVCIGRGTNMTDDSRVINVGDYGFIVALLDSETTGSEVLYKVDFGLNSHFLRRSEFEVCEIEKSSNVENVPDLIINVVQQILSSSEFTVETPLESVLCKLMQINGTPIKFTKTLRNIDKDYEAWIYDRINHRGLK